jgi:hypothetical protein
LKGFTKDEQRSVMRLLYSEGEKTNEMTVPYGDICMDHGKVFELVKRFEEGQRSVDDTSFLW